MIYLDSAATTFQKPAAVPRAVAEAMLTMSSPGRGAYAPAIRASETLLNLREEAGAMFHLSQPEHVILTMNATHGLNIAIRTLVPQSGKVLLSGWEHNAVLRPLAAIPGVKIDTVQAPLFRPDAFLEALERQLTPTLSAVILTHVSNVFGYVLPMAEAAELCRNTGVPLLVDAAQSAGVLPIDADGWEADFIAAPGHKGLYGPQGTGLLLCRRMGEPILYGGTGSHSRLPQMPDFLPDRLEAGTHNVPGGAGLLEGLRFVRRKTTSVLLRHETALKEYAADALEKLPGVEVFRDKTCQTGVLSFRLSNREPGWVADYLNQNKVAVRAGLHCAPMAHQNGGTGETGTVRMSFSAFNTTKEIEKVWKLLRQIV